MDMSRNETVALALLGLVAGCGGRVDPGAPSGPQGVKGEDPKLSTALSGSFDGQSIAVHDTIAVVAPTPGQTEILVSYTDASGLCASLQATEQRAGTQYLSVLLIATSADGSTSSSSPAATPSQAASICRRATCRST
jgi:hypothetical protein